MADPKLVAASYDRVAQAATAGAIDDSAPYRAYNNFVKRELITAALDVVACGARGHRSTGAGEGIMVRVLDIASGRGGDMAKWMQCRPTSSSSEAKRLVVAAVDGYDISSESVKEANRRAAECARRPVAGGRQPPRFEYRVADCFADSFWNDVEQQALSRLDLATHHAASFDGPPADAPLPPGRFDIVSIQFALHYGCVDVASLDRFLAGVSRSLVPGGCFIGTIVDAVELSRQLREEADYAAISSHTGEGLPPPSASSSTLFRLCPLDPFPIAPAVVDRDGSTTAAASSVGVPTGSSAVLPMGFHYRIRLDASAAPKDAAAPSTESLVDCDEYVLPSDTLIRRAALVGLLPCASSTVGGPMRNFAMYAPEWVRHSATVALRRGGRSASQLSPDEQRLVNLYCSFCFVKGVCPPSADVSHS